MRQQILTWLFLVLAPVFCEAADKGKFFPNMSWTDAQFIVCLRTWQSFHNIKQTDRSTGNRDPAVSACRGEVDDFDSAWASYKSFYRNWHWPSRRVYDQARVMNKQWPSMDQTTARFFLCLDLYKNQLPQNVRDENQSGFNEQYVEDGRNYCIASVSGLPSDFKYQLEDFYGWAPLFPSSTVIDQAKRFK
ncbi:hypothetical protein F4778DRAFT_355255 [Xylariomycetidae sp. FL2044]|nr:hypothetical protein F4778DRAFT_355255 [Xylariomycetidae sp. FL2044]